MHPRARHALEQQVHRGTPKSFTPLIPADKKLTQEDSSIIASVERISNNCRLAHKQHRRVGPHQPRAHTILELANGHGTDVTLVVDQLLIELGE